MRRLNSELNPTVAPIDDKQHHVLFLRNSRQENLTSYLQKSVVYNADWKIISASSCNVVHKTNVKFR